MITMREWKGWVFIIQRYVNWLISKYLNNCPANIYLFKVNNKNLWKRCEICPKLSRKTPELRQWRRSGVFIVNFAQISYLFLEFLLLTMSR